MTDTPVAEKRVAIIDGSRNIHQTLAGVHPKLQRGRVWCHTCGHTEAVDSAACLETGWPKCCGQTMSIDSPDERKPL